MELGEKEDTRIRACIIGAGAAGLCAARHLAQHKSKFIFHVYEQTLNVGGTWNYTDSIGFDSNGLPIHSSMYSNMRYLSLLCLLYYYFIITFLLLYINY